MLETFFEFFSLKIKNESLAIFCYTFNGDVVHYKPLERGHWLNYCSEQARKFDSRQLPEKCLGSIITLKDYKHTALQSHHAGYINKVIDYFLSHLIHLQNKLFPRTLQHF